ncbi:Acyl-CoA hydrolase [Arboricoccus pini]|uniref:Acyl-CoA hydrolase n=1 Tax=Arboricoccus pini TaxID=1963835 RepID=A0A212RJE6_9PROT|nr:acyl-CoA thioesterase [Arboricoccus pini]SNB72535.1 Acyl-CoA hydrolase [Arboricoccus pini]
MSDAAIRLIDIVFPGDTNHHGTLFGGSALAAMDKLAFIAAVRHARVDFVTASCDRLDFVAPARLGDIVEFAGRVTRVGRRSLSVELEMTAEAALSDARRRCCRGTFTMVAVGERPGAAGYQLPPLVPAAALSAKLRMVELVMPDQTSHYGTLYGGQALAAMGKAAFVAATRHCRHNVVMAASDHVDFKSGVRQGEIMELTAELLRVGRSSMTVQVRLEAENLFSGERRLCCQGQFVMVAQGPDERPTTVPPLALP